MPKDFSALEQFILEKISEGRIPSVSVAITNQNRIIYSRGFGFRDIESGLPATPRTLYGVGSVTKSFTALAIMQLAEQGKLSLTDPVEKHVPIKLRPHGKTVTIHHLLTHTSGLPALAYAEAFIQGSLGMNQSWLPLSSPEDVISFMRDAKGWAVSKPGERFFYLNEGYVLLGYIISKLGKINYADYVKKHILKPLKMNRTFFSKSEFEKDQDRATPYIIDKEQKQIPSSFPYGITSDGGLISNPVDLANYLMMYIGGGKLRGERLIGRDMLNLMVKPHTTFTREFSAKGSWLPKQYRTTFTYGYGYGWSITPDFAGQTLIGHSGSIGTFTAFIGYIPERKVGVAVLANPSTYPQTIGRYALALAVGANPEKLPFIKGERLLNRLQGRYQTYKTTMTMQVKRAGDFLIAEIKDKYTEETIPLLPDTLEEDYATFYTLVGGVRLPVEFTVHNKKVELIYERYKFEKTG